MTRSGPLRLFSRVEYENYEKIDLLSHIVEISAFSSLSSVLLAL